MFKAIPLFAIPLIAYNLMIQFGDIHSSLAGEVFSMNLISGAQWTLSTAELLIVFGVIILYLEIFKATRTGMASILDHSFSALVFIVFLIEFLVVKSCGTSTFFILGMMSLIDVIAGFTVSIVAARRDFGFGNPDIGQ